MAISYLAGMEISCPVCKRQHVVIIDEAGDSSLSVQMDIFCAGCGYTLAVVVMSMEEGIINVLVRVIRSARHHRRSLGAQYGDGGDIWRRQ